MTDLDKMRRPVPRMSAEIRESLAEYALTVNTTATNATATKPKRESERARKRRQAQRLLPDMSDHAVARRLLLDPSTVRRWRKAAGIKPWPKLYSDRVKAAEADMGSAPDWVVASRYRVSVRAVSRRRQSLGVPTFRSSQLCRKKIKGSNGTPKQVKENVKGGSDE